MYVELCNVNKYYGTYHASKDINISIEQGTVLALLGPSGSGKTTILRMIAGLEIPDSGDIKINGAVVNTMKPRERGIGFLFQNYALFRYMTVFENIAFGLEMQGISKAEIKRRVTELLDLIGLRGLEKRYPSELSGGQKQRVAFARALAPRPNVLLLDEPFAAIDVKVKEELRSWLKETIKKIGITTIFVTHDQEEAVELADYIVVTKQGRVEQIGTPRDIYGAPKTPFVAQFMGKSTDIKMYHHLKGFNMDIQGDSAIIRPECVKIYKKGTLRQYMSAAEEGIIERILFKGNHMELWVRIDEILIYSNASIDDEEFKVGESVDVLIYRLYVFDQNKTYVIENSKMNTDNLYYI